jgi:hypothetical protein
MVVAAPGLHEGIETARLPEAAQIVSLRKHKLLPDERQGLMTPTPSDAQTTNDQVCSDSNTG